MFRFANKELLYLVYIIPVLIIIFLIAFYQRKKAIKRIGNMPVIRELMPEMSNTRHIIKFILILLAIGSLIVAIARPQFGTTLKKVKRRGVELVIALDVSNSMLANDIKPTRLKRAKMAISKLADKLHDDRIGLIVFAGDAYMQIPITIDYSAVKMILGTINTNIVPKQGTDLGSAIDLAINSFDPRSKLEKAMVIITDGENHQGNPIEMAQQATEKGITVHTIGVGSPTGTPIPVPQKFAGNRFKKDNQGNIVISKLDEKVLQQVASAGNGSYIRATNADLGLDKLFKEISKMTEKEMETNIYADYQEQFQYFAALALFLLLLDFVILERKNKWLQKIDIFKPTQKFTKK
jgi:Ca-activated chloride channel family protein